MSQFTRQEVEARIIAKAWKDEAYKQELLTNPKATIEKEFDVELPEQINVKVLAEDSTSLHFVLPMCPKLTEQELSEDELETIAGGTLSAIITGGTGVVTAYLSGEFTKKINF